MKIVIDIDDNETPKRQEIVSVNIHFIDGKVCSCDYPFQLLSEVLDSIKGEIVDRAKRAMNDTRAEGLYMALDIIDKYGKESNNGTRRTI